MSGSETDSTGSNLSGTSTSAEIKRFCKETEDVELPSRKEAGKSGRKIALRSNYYKMKIDPNKQVIHYDVAIKGMK
jgi:hypothetical protein